MIKIHKLIITGHEKPPAALEFNGISHLIFGPTDTGKSYAINCIRYCLGGDNRPEDIGFDGYNTVLLQIEANGIGQFTIFRNLADGSTSIFDGFFTELPFIFGENHRNDISQLLTKWTNSDEAKIIIKSGVLGNITASDLRYISIFSEIETLEDNPIVGKDSNLKTRRKSFLSLALTGSDDSEVKLPPSTTTISTTKGRINALKDEVEDLKNEIPKEISNTNISNQIANTENEISKINFYLKTHSADLIKLKKQRAKLENQDKNLTQTLSALNEAANRFHLLDKKYLSDLDRLSSIKIAAGIIENFPQKPCPICMADIKHQNRHKADDHDPSLILKAAAAECIKISELRNGLTLAISDLRSDVAEAKTNQLQIKNSLDQNLIDQEKILNPDGLNISTKLQLLIENKSSLLIAKRYIFRIDQLETKISELQNTIKHPKKSIERNIGESATELCTKIKKLLEAWGVPGVDLVSYDKKVADIEINHRRRISYGKGKRGIFLTAYMIALMERSIARGSFHLGFVAIDSPVVTYKDPKHGNKHTNDTSNEKEDLLPISVKDKFYLWLSQREGEGQIIVFENEEPSPELRSHLKFTEFSGENIIQARSGLFPTN